MARVSARPVAFASQSSVATRNSRAATVANGVRASVERLRVSLINEAPTGFQKEVADLMSWRKERISREVHGPDKLSVELVLAEVAWHREQGRPETAARLLGLLSEGQTVQFSPDRAVIRFHDGQLFLDFDPVKA